MNKVIVADIASHRVNGHSIGHYHYVAQNLIEVFADKADMYIAGGPVYIDRFGTDRVLALPYDAISTQNVIKKKWGELVNCRKLFKEAKGAKIIMQHAALATTLIGIALFKKDNCKLYQIVYSQEGINTRFKRFWYKFAKKKIDGIICPQQKLGDDYDRNCCVVPDYIYVGENSNCELDYKNKTFDFCVVGRLSPEKGVDEIIEKLRGTNYRVLIAGNPQTKKIADRLTKLCKGYENINLRLGYIDDDDYYRYIKESRYCILNYYGEYSERSSGVVFDILFNGVPVVGRRCKSLEFIEEHNVGIVFDDIKDWSPDTIMDVKLYEDYLNKIVSYRKTHRDYANKLKNFVMK